ncbi:tRNA (adenosine(37)-N6)-threonylcarbamoyltransferase complex ATPase subunit type 1 TsaE [Candidatus Daviesbacteria bacterium RIFCSPLOWO2_01_FULL_39_12]|uniref:tRNA threonylcarbamoyladenosine biosynthesis protein TsaE n=1 Tax=Candidatus Daviesbacteria bacterium RIFCSPLOWO2_01_FULL_39_12 TaxID=1797785 RepID=A0A1F5KSA4_9BACT|nr:MAG: tRNA (adenosine(37)-N6)-threonylcarbamoyltransferase complex ATPase subunit type 1 TsaE [Candidatus Daviesbacteria bacterium RIFCSPHIGHO2_02_FULL_39_8]OGE43709.1 MAG: tRNA (adenosine(37)-N6)-threonylcarbamoyltransferase complex ATPase subunit type 1 TsaE [Candidatus Daviesbacteria bacterium RIFCSPLOWO2_01_FULL_39_12]
MGQFITRSDKETRQLAKKLAKERRYKVVGLVGELGAGKTTFVQGFAQGLGIKEKIISPTFVLIRQHKIPKSKKTLFHIDLYRLEMEREFEDLGLKEILQNPEAVVVIEWAEKIKSILPKIAALIYFKKLDDHQRKITIKTLS